MFLIRTAFWLAVVVMLLPTDEKTAPLAPRPRALDPNPRGTLVPTDMSTPWRPQTARSGS